MSKPKWSHGCGRPRTSKNLSSRSSPQRLGCGSHPEVSNFTAGLVSKTRILETFFSVVLSGVKTLHSHFVSIHPLIFASERRTQASTSTPQDPRPQDPRTTRAALAGDPLRSGLVRRSFSLLQPAAKPQPEPSLASTVYKHSIHRTSNSDRRNDEPRVAVVSSRLGGFTKSILKEMGPQGSALDTGNIN